MGMGFAPTWLGQVSPLPPPLLHMTTLTTAVERTKVLLLLLRSNVIVRLLFSGYVGRYRRHQNASRPQMFGLDVAAAAAVLLYTVSTKK